MLGSSIMEENKDKMALGKSQNSPRILQQNQIQNEQKKVSQMGQHLNNIKEENALVGHEEEDKEEEEEKEKIINFYTNQFAQQNQLLNYQQQIHQDPSKLNPPLQIQIEFPNKQQQHPVVNTNPSQNQRPQMRQLEPLSRQQYSSNEQIKEEDADVSGNSGSGDRKQNFTNDYHMPGQQRVNLNGLTNQMLIDYVSSFQPPGLNGVNFIPGIQPQYNDSNFPPPRPPFMNQMSQGIQQINHPKPQEPNNNLHEFSQFKDNELLRLIKKKTVNNNDYFQAQQHLANQRGVQSPVNKGNNIYQTNQQIVKRFQIGNKQLSRQLGAQQESGVNSKSFNKQASAVGGATAAKNNSNNEYISKSDISGNEHLAKMLSRLDRATSFKLLEEIENHYQNKLVFQKNKQSLHNKSKFASQALVQLLNSNKASTPQQCPESSIEGQLMNPFQILQQKQQHNQQSPNQLGDMSLESKVSLPKHLSRADFGNLLMELCVKLGINNFSNMNENGVGAISGEEGSIDIATSQMGPGHNLFNHQQQRSQSNVPSHFNIQNKQKCFESIEEKNESQSFLSNNGDDEEELKQPNEEDEDDEDFENEDQDDNFQNDDADEELKQLDQIRLHSSQMSQNVLSSKNIVNMHQKDSVQVPNNDSSKFSNPISSLNNPSQQQNRLGLSNNNNNNNLLSLNYPTRQKKRNLGQPQNNSVNFNIKNKVGAKKGSDKIGVENPSGSNKNGESGSSSNIEAQHKKGAVSANQVALNNLFQLNQGDLLDSKSYIYLSDVQHSIQREEIASNSINQPSLPRNYRSAFFENDSEMEDYHRKLRDALRVQVQKEVNIGFEEINKQYVQWAEQFQHKYQKKPGAHKKTLVFDLDETLVRAQRDEFENGYDSRITVIDPQSVEGCPPKQYFIYIKFRPHLIDMLTQLKKHYELLLFTAAQEQYANVVLESFGGHQFFDHILSRQQCLFIFEHSVYVKDLTILLGNRTLADIVIIDNKVESYASHLENGIPITDYLGQEDDEMLEILTRYLIKMKDCEDVRHGIMKDFEVSKSQLQRHQQQQEEPAEDDAFNGRETIRMRMGLLRARNRDQKRQDDNEDRPIMRQLRPSGLLLKNQEDESEDDYDEEEEKKEDNFD